MSPKISVIIPIKNAAVWLDQLIEKILLQTLAPISEIIFIDSGSEDDSINIVKKYPEIHIIQIHPDQFNHGSTRNLGVSKASGEYIVFSVQDALPSDNLWLQELLKGFINEKVVAVCGKQIVSHDNDKNPVQWHRPVTKPSTKVYQFEDVHDFQILSPENKNEICAWDNVNAMYKREILLKIPFNNLAFGEDAMWAKNAIESGFAIAYNSAACVAHYHYETSKFSYDRTLIEVFFMYKIFGKLPQNKGYNLNYHLSVIKLLLFDSKVKPMEKLKWFRHNYQRIVAKKKAINYFICNYNKGVNALLELEREINTNVPQGNGELNLKY